ncbi:MAG: M48 family metalloprotease [Pseudonocardiaceae bacterium]
MVVFLIGALLNSGVGLALILLWLVSGTAVLSKLVERVLIRRFLGFRWPTGAERQGMAAAWQKVAAAAGVDPARYILVIDDTRVVNASASAGHLVAVTRKALQNLTPVQLAGVLAHEFGHHLGSAPGVGLLMYWYSLPGRVVGRTFRAVGRMMRFVVKWWMVGVIGDIVGYVIMMGLLVFAVAVQLWWVVPLYAIPFLLAFTSRREEFRADREAVRLGFGGSLASALEYLQQVEDEQFIVGRPGFLRRLLASHPPITERIRRLEAESITT